MSGLWLPKEKPVEPSVFVDKIRRIDIEECIRAINDKGRLLSVSLIEREPYESLYVVVYEADGQIEFVRYT